MNRSGQEGGFSNEVSHLTRNSTPLQSYNVLKPSSPHLLMNFSCLGHLKVFQGSHPTPRVAWLDSSVELSPRFLSPVGKVFLLYRLAIVRPIKGSPRPNCRGLVVVQLVSPAHKNEASNLADCRGCQQSPNPLARGRHQKAKSRS